MAYDAEIAPAEKAKLLRLKTDFEFFARNCLFIRTKSGEIKPFALNKAQKRLHETIQDIERRKGRVRAVILKGRQMGASTYIQARFYWRLWCGQGLQAFILTHEQPATDNMFAMAGRFHEFIPPFLRPKTKAANAKELAFADNNCSYAVATAGTKGVGRSSTLQLFHGSEVAFWPNAETHIDGAFQAIADASGTERILESTANGIGNVFQRRYVAAERGDSDEEAIFLPWFWDDGYERDPGDWQPSKDWWDYGKTHKLPIEKLYWAYCKNRDMASALAESPDKPCWKFMQEYPATAQEAFQTAGNSFIPSTLISKARKTEVVGLGPLIIGIDPARGGGDKTGVIDRRGRRLGQHIMERWDDADTMVIAGKCHRLITQFRPDAMNIDVGGLGAGIYDRLVEMGHGRIVNAVNFGSSALGIGPTGDEIYANRRAEMWDVMRDWHQHVAGVQIPDDDLIHADLASVVWGGDATRWTSANELLLEPKDKIRKRLGFSPDLGDAAALTFAVPVAEYQDDGESLGRPKGSDSVTGY